MARGRKPKKKHTRCRGCKNGKKNDWFFDLAHLRALPTQCSCQAKEACASCLSFLTARQRISSQSQCRTRFCWYCHLRKTPHHFRILASNSRELRESSIGEKSCSRGHQAFIDLKDELVANFQVGLEPDSLSASCWNGLSSKHLKPGDVLSTSRARGSRLDGANIAGEDHDTVRH